MSPPTKGDRHGSQSAIGMSALVLDIVRMRARKPTRRGLSRVGMLLPIVLVSIETPSNLHASGWSSRSPADYLKNLGHDIKRSVVGIGQHNRFIVRVHWPECDLHVSPRGAVPCLLAFVALDGVSLAAFRVGGVTHLREDGLAMPATFDGCTKQAMGTVRDGWLHGLPDQLSDKHAATEAASGVDRDPLEILVFDKLWVAEYASGRLKGNERHAGNEAVCRLGFDDP